MSKQLIEFFLEATVEPIVFLASFSFGIIEAPGIWLYFEKTCKHNSQLFPSSFNFNETVCENWDEFPGVDEVLSTQVTKLRRVSGYLQLPFKILAVLFLASWSDQFQNRRFLVVYPILGYCALCILKISQALSDQPSADYLLLESLQDVTGGLPLLMLGAFATISDLKTNLLTRFALLEAAFVAGFGLGNATGSALFKDHNYTSVYVTGLLIMIATLFYAFFFHRKKHPVTIKKAVRMLNPKHLISTLKVFTEEKKSNKNFSIAIFFLSLAAFAIIDFVSGGEPSVDLEYVQETFNLESRPEDLKDFWTTFYSIYMVWATLTLVIAVPVLSQMFNVSDSVFIILSGLGSFLRALIFLLARNTATLNAVFVLDMFGLSGLISARAIVMKMSSDENIAKILAFFAIVQAIVESLTVEYYNLYMLTRKDFYEKFIYCFNALAFLTVVIVAAIIHFFVIKFREKATDQKIVDRNSLEDITTEIAETTIRGMAIA